MSPSGRPALPGRPRDRDAMEQIEASPEPACRQFQQEYGPSRPGLRRALFLSLAFALLLATGLYLEFLATQNWNAGEPVLVLHIVLGLAFTGVFLSWITAHVLRGLPKSRRPGFTWLSWLLLATYALVLASGLLMIVPVAVRLSGGLWFWRFEATYLLTFLHLWAAIAAAVGLIVHLVLRHWALPADRKGRSAP